MLKVVAIFVLLSKSLSKTSKIDPKPLVAGTYEYMYKIWYEPWSLGRFGSFLRYIVCTES